MIRYIDVPSAPAALSAATPEARVVRTRSVTEPVDAGCEALPKTPLNIGNTVTENTSSVTEIIPPVTTGKAGRGRPPKPDALTAAEKQRRYRDRLKAAERA